MAEQHRACASCGATNEEDARFCEGCGGSLARLCGTCGVEATATARFCRGCGAPLDGQVTQDAPAAGPVRKTVTVMFADLAGSTSFEEKVDAETAREVIGRYHELLRSTAERHHAGVTKYIGDGFMAVWGVPEIGPDDAAHAVDAAAELQERFVDLAARVTEIHGVELALRVAVNTGEVVVGAGDADLVGDALNVGARLEAECPRGRVVVGEETWRSTRGRYRYESLGELLVKGRTAPVAVYQWLGQSEAADAAPFVGRADEIRRLAASFDDAVAARAARLITVMGDPGVGKSRLAAEFTGARGDARVVQARCDVQGTVALAPIVEVLRARDLEIDVPASVPERDRLLRDLNGLATGVPGSVEETFWALRRYVEVLASDGPVLLVLDDIQWADTLLLDFVEHLVEWVQEVPVLVLALARPELREIRPDLVTVSQWVSEAIHLSGLDAGATAELAANVLGATRLPEDLLRRLPASTGGNPLFVRELVGMLAHDGVLVEEPIGWRLTIDVDAIAIPPTIHALLASRLERLDAADRRVLEIASVVGTEFSLGAVAALAGSSSAVVKRSLDRLRRLDLAQPSGAYVGDEPVWRFHHVLIRDVAYRRLLKSDRADLHERLADWAEAGGPSVAFDSDEMIARHLEAAHRYRLELGTLDEHTENLALRAARHYVASARRALDRDELVSAGTQAARGAALATADEAIHAELLLVGCEAFLSAGDVAAGAPLVDDLDRIAGDALAPWATCYRCQFVVYTDPERLLEVEARLEDAIGEFSRRPDPAGLAKAHRVRASARLRLGRVGDGELDLFEALIAARQSGDHRQITAALGAAPGAALWGPSPVPKAGGRCLDVVRMQRMTTAAPSLEATSLRCLAVLELLRGRPDKARTMLADARQVVADLGLRHGLMETELFAGIIESMDGDQVAAEPHFRTAMEGLDALGVGADAGQAAALLARSVLAQGRINEADRYASESERIAGHNLKTAIAWRAVRGEILAAHGRHDEAAAMAREAVALAAGTDLVLDHALACLSLSRVLDAAGDARGANGARDDAERLYAAKEVAGSIGRSARPVASATVTPAEAVPTVPRLAVTNESLDFLPAFSIAMRAHDVEGAIECYADRLIYDDRRRVSGDPILGRDAIRAATKRVFEQYTQFEFRVLAVRGERLYLVSSRMSDDDGNETVTLDVGETGEDGRVEYLGRFDEDDFESAYRELENRYYAGEGAAFVEAGAVLTDALIAINQGDLDRMVNELIAPGFRLENRSRSAFPDRSVAEFRATEQALAAMVASQRAWYSAQCWLSPTCSVVHFEREAVGHNGEQYTWSWLIVGEVRDGRIASLCQFELDDEDAAFAYAEERVRATTSRLAVTNQSCEFLPAFHSAMEAHDIESVLKYYADQYVYDDHRRISGDPVLDLKATRGALARVFEQYSQFRFRVLAVRGQRLNLHWSCWSDEDGNETTTLYVGETGEDGRIIYQGRFDEDDFEGAYRELENRYYAGEGAAFVEGGTTQNEWMTAANRGDLDRVFDEFTSSDLCVVNRSRSAFPDRSAAEFRASLEELAEMVASVRTWNSAICWLSPTCSVVLTERDAVGKDGEQYTWSFLLVVEVHDGRNTSMCLFDIDDEESAFAHAEERVRATTSRLAVNNRASETWHGMARAAVAFDADAAVSCYADQFVYDDRRGLSGDAIESLAALRAAAERLFEQYSRFEGRVLAVRGERLALVQGRWSDDDGNESRYLHLYEVGDDGRFACEVRFDEDDFEGAYRELERLYHAGEGAAFAKAGAIGTEWLIALSQGDFDRLFGELTSPDLRVEDRSRAQFPYRSATEFRASLEELNAMVASARTWSSVACWLSPMCTIMRADREALGHDGEQYAWTWLSVAEVCDGQLTSMRFFELDDEDAAFAYAEERIRAATSRLAVTNRASEIIETGWRALPASDVDALVAGYADQFVYDDHRRLGGDPIVGPNAMRLAIERILTQYSRFELRTLAVRGERLLLARSRWSDDAGNETAHLHVAEIGDDGRVTYDGRFDEDDFEGAYRELETRYYAGEGAAFAELGFAATDWITAVNRGDLDSAFSERYYVPDGRLENRSRSAFPDPVVSDLGASFRELNAMVASTRTWVSAMIWLSATCVVGRFEREAVGLDGEQYSWTWLSVSESHDGRISSGCVFDLEDEDAAFAYAEERVRATTSRLAVTNRASETGRAITTAVQAHDVDTIVGLFSESFGREDRRRLHGNPILDIRTAFERILEQYPKFEGRTLAVRGESLYLGSAHWRNDAGYESTHLHLHEIDESGRVTSEVQFDEDDFENAYRELDRRYYAGEGAAFADAGTVATETMIALNQGDLNRAFGELFAPEMRFEDRSRSVVGDLSATQWRASLEELAAMVATSRAWNSAVRWLSPTCGVFRSEREAVGVEGERYIWSFLHVVEIRAKRVTSLCQFELEDEEAAFAYAEERMRATTSRLAVTNRASGVSNAMVAALRAHDVHGAARCFSETWVYDDRRRLTGNPVDNAWAGLQGILQQYNRFEGHTLAVRGERLHLLSSRWSDDAGNETAHLHLHEIGDDGRIVCEVRFDEDDFEGAYRELEARYFAGEGAAFAEGIAASESLLALNRGDIDRFFGEFCTPDFCVENRSRSAFPDRSANDLRASLEDLNDMVESVRMWMSAVYWLSPACSITRFDREAVGKDGEQYTWTQLLVAEHRHGRFSSMFQFEIDDEEAAFAYAEERMRARTSRLAVTNRASDRAEITWQAIQAHDADTVLAAYADQFVYDDQRRLSGGPIVDQNAMRSAIERLLQQYSRFEWRTLGVRGENLHLCSSRWSDDAGNETAYLHVREIGDDGLVVYDGRFDEDDFEGAYRELDRRYYSGEGAAFADAGAVATEWPLALNRGDFDRLFGEFSSPDLRVENRSRALFPDRSATEFRASLEELNAMVATAWTWSSVVCWVSPKWVVNRFEREALGHDGERYTWSLPLVAEIRGGRVASMCMFEPEDEESAFAYAEERMRATASRLAVTNRASETTLVFADALRANDLDGVMACISDGWVYDDRRRLGGNPPGDVRVAMARIREQYNHFEGRTLAVRGERLHLLWSSWSDDAGNVSNHLHVREIDDDGRIACEVRFDEDDFEGAYRELNRRYYDGEGAAFAEAGAVATEWPLTLNRGDFDRVFGELSSPDLRVENRSRALFPDRSATEFRATLEELNAMVASARTWSSVDCWLSPTWVVGRFEREALGQDGEQYTWSLPLVTEIRGGRVTSFCMFELDDEEAAFAYAEERMRATASRLAVTNRASQAAEARRAAMDAADVNGAVACCSDEFVQYDQRRLSGDPIRGVAELRVACERALAQYSRFEVRTLAVRGERLHLFWGRWSNQAGYESTHLGINEIDDEGRISCQIRFDEDDFEGAYRELDRRYYAGEGAAFAEAGSVPTEYATALNRSDFDRAFSELSTADFRLENRSRSGFGDRSAAELRTTYVDLTAMAASVRMWHSAICWLSPTMAVGRFEREAAGHDGERYTWTLIDVAEIRDGRLASASQFELEDEEAAFAYAEERVRAAASRLAVTNRASRTWDTVARAMQGHDLDAAVASYTEPFVYDDRRRLAGNPIGDVRTAQERILAQFTNFEWRTLAVRGERLHLGWSRWRNDSGFETSYLYVHEVGEDGRFIYEGRFDEDDFEGAYRELTRRYGAGEGAAFAELSAAGTEWLIAANKGDFDRVFGELTTPDLRVVNRSSSVFPDRSASELRATYEELYAMVASVRSWNSVEYPLGSTCGVARQERLAVGHDGEQFAWTRLYVYEAVEGRLAGIGEFEPDDEAAAFAYAEERLRATGP